MGPGPRPRRFPRTLVRALVVVVGFGLAALVFVNAQSGFVTLNVSDPDATLLVDGDEIPRDQWGRQIRLKTGKHELVVKRGGAVVVKQEFTVDRDNPQFHRLTLPPAKE